MAKLKVFTVYDAKVEAYMQPFMLQSQGQAVRSWMDVVNDAKTQFSKHPEDFTLFYIADYDENTGRYENLTAPVPVATALEYHEGRKTYDKVSSTGAQQ